MMLRPRQAQIPGLRNLNHIHHLRQVDKKDNVRIVKKSMASVLDHLRWEDERVFQSTWECDDGSVLVFFSNIIKDIEIYANNWMMCHAANIHRFLAKKGRDKEDVNRMLEKCFSPDELVKISNVSYNGPLVVLKEKVHIDTTEMVQTSRQFDMDRGLSKEEKLSRVQQAAASRIQYGAAPHGGPVTFNFEADYDDVKTVTHNKKVGDRDTNFVSEKTFAENVFGIAGNTTLPSCQGEEDETDSFVSSVCSVAKDNVMDTGGRVRPQTEIQTPRHANTTFIDLSKKKRPHMMQNLAWTSKT